MASIRTVGLTKRFRGQDALVELDLEVAHGELMVLVGPSGSGKSTALRLLAGLEAPSAGRILIDGREVTDLPPRRRDVAMVFQSYALYPHMSARDNLGFGLRVRKVARAEVARRVEEAAEALGISELLDRKPATLSGGQRQRVALGRAIVRDPAAFLLDEPLSNLDARLRVRTRAEIAQLHRRLGATMVYVTHDQTEAMTLGDRVAVLHEGRLQQVGPPAELYRRPANRFVGEFIGSPAMNVLEGVVVREEGRTLFRGGGLSVALPEGTDATGPVLLGFRPHEAAITPADDAKASGRAEVEMVETTGPERLVHLRLPEGEPVTVVTPPERGHHGTTVGISVSAGAAHLFRPDDGRRLD